MTRVLIADDEPVVRMVLGKFLEKEGRELLLAADADEAVALARKHAPIDVALLDKNLGEHSGLELARRLQALQQDLAVVLITGYASLQSAIEAVQIGAYDYLAKPFDDPASLDLKVSNAEERVRLARERRALAAALAESEERYRSVFDTSPDAILLIDPSSGLVREANRSAREIFKQPAGLAGADVSVLLGASSPAQLTPPGGVAVTGRRSDGSTFEAEVRPGSLTLRGEELHTLAVRDVSARERLVRERIDVEQQLRHVQKMDAIGRLAGGLGHDLGNLLAVIMTYLELLREDAEGSVREDLGEAQTAADRAAHLVKQLMTLARQGPSRPVALSVSESVTETARLMRRSLPEDVAIRTELAPGLWASLLDPDQLAQVLINLCVNARDAMPRGGKLTLTTANLQADGPRPAGVPPGAWVLLSVADSGCGMSAEVRERVFEPFFTTKEEGKGTGLGLSVVYGIVRQAGGFIAVESAPDQGTTFRIGFPPATTRAPARAEASSRPSFSGRGLTVLVAEDEDAVRTAVVRSLTGVGFQVLQGDCAQTALAAARAHGSPIDLLLTDLVMPGESGAQLARALRRERPEVKVLFMTGFPGDARTAEALAENTGSDVMQKPFKHSTLVERVRRMIAG